MTKKLGKRLAARKNTVTAFACNCNYSVKCTCSGTPSTAFLEDQNRQKTRADMATTHGV